MNKKIAGILLALCMALVLLPVQAMADDAMPKVKLDVSMENTENDDYKVMDGAINIRKENVVYELTGTTGRKLQMWGSNSPDPVKTFYLRLNNATINGGLTITNSYGAKLVIEVMDDTTNTIKNVYAVDLTIAGKGMLNAEDLGVTQQSSSDSRQLKSALYIKDTTIVVTQPTDIGDSSQWNGTCVLDGDANVTYTSTTEYSALKLGQTHQFDHSLTMKGNSKLYCLQKDATAVSNHYVSGLEGFNATITLQDNAYLEGQGRQGTDSEYGYTGGNGILSGGDIIVGGNATIKATAYGAAISTWGNVKMNGGRIIANSTESNGIYAAGDISIKNGQVEATGYYPALFAGEDLTAENSTVKATSAGDLAIYSQNKAVTLTNSMVYANGADGKYGIYGEEGVQASGSWVETSGPETLESAPSSIKNSVLFNGKEGKVIGNAVIPADVTVAEGMKLTVPEGTSLIVPEGKTLTNHGVVTVSGEISRVGNVVCDSHSYNWQSENGQYWQQCKVCGHETEKKAIPEITIKGADKVCRTQDYKFSFTLPEGVTNRTCMYMFKLVGDDIVPAAENGVYSGTVKATAYQAGENSFKLVVTAETEDGFTFTTEKVIAIQNEHTGGEATCKDKAACEVCGERYGEPDAKNHKALQHVEAKAATKDAKGNIEYWYCADCGKYFKDAAATAEITKADTVTAKLTDSGKPDTGDRGSVLWVAVLLISGAAIGVTATERKRRHQR